MKTDTPAACIVCLSCLNNGRALGKWATIEQIAEEVTAEQITYIGQGETATYPSGSNYTACKVCGADEWELADHEHLPHSTRNLKALYENAEQISELHNSNELEQIIILGEWLDVGGHMSIEELIAYHEANYHGEYNTPKDFAEHMADALAVFDGTENEIVANCFDYEQYYYGWLQHDYTEEQGHYWGNR
jgi:hypothetical protein